MSMPHPMDNLPSLYSKLGFDRVRDRLKAYAASELGKQLTEEIVPFTDLQSLLEELQNVSECKLFLETEQPCLFDGVKDIRSAVHKAGIEGNYISAPDLRDVFATLRAARLIRQSLSKQPNRYPRISSIAKRVHVDRVLEFNIEQAIDENGNVKDSASKDLRELRRAILFKSDELRMQLERILKRYSERGYAQEEIVTTRDGRMVVPVKVEHKHHVPGFIHSSSASGATVFIEPADTLEMNNEIRTLRFSEQREIENILRNLTRQVREIGTELLIDVEVLAQLDFDFAKAKYSIEILGSLPQVTDHGPLMLHDARHPILLQMHARDQVVPLTLELGKSFQTLIITGPNAGGKTVALKTVGILTLMVACGLHIPSSPDSVVPIFNQIFIDVGDEQSIENDLSSFTSHLLNLKAIVQNADERTLVLIDEIGAGTDPSEGGAIASAVLTAVKLKGSLTIATTHHGALKAFAHETPGFENGAMEFDQITLRPTYHFKHGVPGSSYAIEIASRLGLPETTIMMAKELLGPKRDRLESLIADVEQKSQKLAAEQAQLEQQNVELGKLVDEYESKLRVLSRELKEKRAIALREAQHIIDEANALIESSVKEIRAQSAASDSIRQGKADVQSFRESISSQLEAIENELSLEVPTETISEGDFVNLRGHRGIGQVVSSLEGGKAVLVEFEGIRMQVSKRDLVRATTAGAPASLASFVSETADVKTEIDLRGMTGDEAVAAVDKFLDGATLAALHSVNIIHGKGTGALRKRISDFLKGDPRVRSFRLGEWNEGGSGATIVDLHK
jgi:DNA mismatch repair protein MutS2